MTMQIFMWLSIGWMPVLMFVMLRNETRFKKNIVLGVTFPYKARKDEEVLALLKQFSSRSLAVMLLLLAAVIPGLFIRSFAVSFMLWGCWLLLAIALPYIPYIQCHNKLKTLKAARGWKRVDAGIVRVDPDCIPNGKWLSPWLFLPAALLCLLPILWSPALWMLYLIFASSVVLFYFCYRYLYRNRSEMADDNPDLTKVLTQVRRHNWGKAWMICACGFALMSLSAALAPSAPLWSVAAGLALAFGMSAAVICIELRTRRIQETLTKASGQAWYPDEDDYWLGGILYHNPNDRHLLINNRIGINSSINLARPAGKVIAVLVLLLMLGMPFLGFAIGQAGTKTLTLDLSDTTLKAGSYEIAVDDLSDVQLLAELPKNMIRTWGTALDSYLSGRFSATGLGALKLRLDPQHPPFILLRTKNGQQFLFGTRDVMQTREVFQKLTERLP